METLIDILLILVLIGLAPLPIIFFMFYVLFRRIYNDWIYYLRERPVAREDKEREA